MVVTVILPSLIIVSYAQQERQDAVPQTAVVDAGLDKADGPDQTK